jgi:anaerobic ribonucleoside-triphosphate reductase activating protein
MIVFINKIHFPVTVLGPGRRIGIWFQGCSIRCPGCLSQDTWSNNPSQGIRILDLISWCRIVGRQGFDGITITGGEPFEQAGALKALLLGLHAWRSAHALSFDVLCYSGMSLKKLRADYGNILKLLDALIPDPFIQDLPQDRIWRGSANQSLIPISAIGKKRFALFVNKAPGRRRGIQLHVSENQIWYVGIPRPGDLEKLRNMCERRGLLHKEISWRM